MNIKLKWPLKIFIAILLSLLLSLLMKFIFQTKIPSEALNPNTPYILGKFKGANLGIIVGDIAFPNDTDRRPDIYKPDVTTTLYDTYIVSSVLTDNGESWTWLPKSVGDNIDAVDKVLGKKYENEIIKGINWKNNPNVTVKEFVVPQNSIYGSISHVKSIYAISLFNAFKKTNASKKRKLRLQEAITLSVKHILENYISPSPQNSRICIPALSGVWGTVDAQHYLTYYQSWTSIFNGISKISDTKGIDEIYFVIWERLIQDKEHFHAAANGFIKAYDVFNRSYTKAIFMTCLVASILGVILKYLIAFKFKVIQEIIISILPGMLSVFGILKSDILSYNFLSFINIHYFLTAIMLGAICFYWASTCFTLEDKDNTG